MADPEADVDVRERNGVRLRVQKSVARGGWAAFVLFAVFAFGVFLFTFATVHRGRATALDTNFFSQRSRQIITYWREHGYLESGGLMPFSSAFWSGPPEKLVFYRSSTGGYMISGYVIERVAMALTGRYHPLLLAIHNELMMLISAALGALLVDRLLIRIGLRTVDAVMLTCAAELVFLTFPEVQAQYWELSAQPAALPFAFLFLLLDGPNVRSARVRAAQGAAAFVLVYFEFILGFFFLASYAAFSLLATEPRPKVRALLTKAALPAAAALILFAAQLAYVRARHPEVPLEGTSFMARTGLDGDVQYYRDHRDILAGRDLAARNFPPNSKLLFRWPSLLIAGILATGFVIVAGTVQRRLRPILCVVTSFVGGYVLYAALFSQAVVIHPYLYDLVIATPLIFSLFAFAPAILEVRRSTTGVMPLVVAFVAIWYSMVQLRAYSVWYPLPQTKAAAWRDSAHGLPARAAMRSASRG